ncbi:unnamed protein product [Arctogadus glacialis]
MWNQPSGDEPLGQVSARVETTPGNASISVSQQQAPKKFAPVVAPKPKFNPYKGDSDAAVGATSGPRGPRGALCWGGGPLRAQVERITARVNATANALNPGFRTQSAPPTELRSETRTTGFREQLYLHQRGGGGDGAHGAGLEAGTELGLGLHALLQRRDTQRSVETRERK